MASGKLTKEIIEAAILGFEEQKRKIDTQIDELRATSSGPCWSKRCGTAGGPSAPENERGRQEGNRRGAAEAMG
jgi:hypothetical protein